ncbi:hypothetical protein PENSPDRAFT_660838 [Peniophora sp. CONT]|nr:hypothetical protein PENSPDRAFT_660838 [Peniophora sp. CONT]
MFSLRKLIIRSTRSRTRHSKCAEVMQFEAAPTSPIVTQRMPAIRRQSRYAPAHAPFFFEDQTPDASNESNTASSEPELEHCLASSDFSIENHQVRTDEAEEAMMRAADPVLMQTADKLGEQLAQADGRVDRQLCPELEEVLAHRHEIPYIPLFMSKLLQFFTIYEFYRNVLCALLALLSTTTTSSTMSDTAPPSVMSFDDISDFDIAAIVSSSSPTGQASEFPSRVSTPGLQSEPIKHPRFYYKDGSLSFWFEDALFRIHGSVFASLSPFWDKKLDSVESLNMMQEDIDVSSTELSSFLSILYPMNFCEPEFRSVGEWTAVLRLASIWEFESIRELAIKQLDGRLLPLDRLVLSRSYDIPDWLLDGFVGIILRDEPLTTEELQRLSPSIQDIVHIIACREAVFSKTISSDECSMRRHVLQHVLKAPVSLVTTVSDSLPAHASDPSHTTTQSAIALSTTEANTASQGSSVEERAVEV